MIEAGGRDVLVGGNVGTRAQHAGGRVHARDDPRGRSVELPARADPDVPAFDRGAAQPARRHISTGMGDTPPTRRPRPASSPTRPRPTRWSSTPTTPEVLRLARGSRARRVAYALTEPISERPASQWRAARIVRRTAAGDDPLVAALGGPSDGPASAERRPGRERGGEPRRRVRGRHDRAPWIGSPGSTTPWSRPARWRGCGSSTIPRRRTSRRRGAPSRAAATASWSSWAGVSRGGDLASLVPLLERRADAVVAIGEIRRRIRETFEPAVRVVEVGSLDDAVRAAHGLAVPRGHGAAGAGVRQSRTCSGTTAERGRVFVQAVARLRGGGRNEAREQ